MNYIEGQGIYSDVEILVEEGIGVTVVKKYNTGEVDYCYCLIGPNSPKAKHIDFSDEMLEYVEKVENYARECVKNNADFYMEDVDYIRRHTYEQPYSHVGHTEGESSCPFAG